MQGSPYRLLLKPKSGVAFVLDAMGEGLHSIIDVTIAYPAGTPSLLDLLADRVPKCACNCDTRHPSRIPARRLPERSRLRVQFQQWMRGLWQDKENGDCADAGAGCKPCTIEWWAMYADVVRQCFGAMPAPARSADARSVAVTSGRLCAAAAFLEGLTWAGLLVGMWLKYGLQVNDTGVGCSAACMRGVCSTWW